MTEVSQAKSFISELPPEADDHAVAAALATAAGRRLMEIRTQIGFADAAALRSAGDQGAQDLLAEQLARLRPEDSVLSEEARDDPARLEASRVWIIDPLDGTREFSEAGRTDWAVHVALWVKGELVAGAVALPGREITLCTPDVTAPQPDPARRLRLVVSRTRPPAEAHQVAASLDAELVPLGSAPVAVAVAAGLHASRLDGSALVYNRPDPYLPDLLVCRPELAKPVLDSMSAD